MDLRGSLNHRLRDIDADTVREVLGHAPRQPSQTAAKIQSLIKAARKAQIGSMPHHLTDLPVSRREEFLAVPAAISL